MGECSSNRLLERGVIWSEKGRCSSNMKLRFRAERVVFLSPISKNSVIDELRVRRLAVIQEEIY